MAFLHQQPTHCLGFDVAKDSITICGGAPKAAVTIANTRSAIRAVLRTGKADLIVCEPTGGYELLLLEEALRAGIACHRADTTKLKGFIRSFGINGKTDAIDAARLAAYGRERWRMLPLWQAPDAQERKLRALVRRRQELVTMKVAEQNRARAPANKTLAVSFKAVIAVLKRQIETIETAMRNLVAQSGCLNRRAGILSGMSGIGPLTAAALLASLPELGSMTRRQAASLAGVAPHPNDSGLKKGYRKMRGGRPDVRSMLFMPALRAAAGQGEFAAFYKRLVANGKKPIAAVAAVMRKIVVTLNARLRDAEALQS
jgi:transposase